MRTYYFSVICGNNFQRFYISSKTLKTALKLLESEIINFFSYCQGRCDYVVCKPYKVITSTGTSFRSLRSVVKGKV